jgi:sugar transferase (PEP-CTERM/EpsH1 system associated)
MNPSHRHAQSFPDGAATGATGPAAAVTGPLSGPLAGQVSGTVGGPYSGALAHALTGLTTGAAARPRLVAHLVDTLASANMEGDLLNLIRHLPADRYRHAIVCLRDQGDCEAGLREQGIEIVKLHQRAGGGMDGMAQYLRLYRVLRSLQPDLIHTRNQSGLPAQLVAALAGVRLRVHAEHGRDLARPGRTGLRGKLWRRMLRPLVDHFIVVSSELEQWLIEAIGAEPARVSQIGNGVDSVQFHPRLGPAAAVGPPGFMHDGVFVIGSIGRMDDSASHAALVDAFLRLIASPHPAHQRLRLMIVGDGPARAECEAMLKRAGAAARAWLPGARTDTAQLLRAMDLFVLPSLIEDRSSAILEAMASGLPVVATSVGCNAELVHAGFTGILVPPTSVELLSAAVSDYCRIPEMAARHGARARSQVIAHHSMPAMARDYLAVYDALMGLAGADTSRPDA